MTSVRSATRWAVHHQGDLLRVGILALFLVKRLVGLCDVIDVPLDDETNYVYRGVELLRLGLPRPEWNPLYAVWYWLLSRFTPDPTIVFYANLTLLAALIPLLIYLLVRASGGPPLAALTVAVWFSLTGLMDVYPYPSHLAVTVLLCGTLLATRAKTWSATFVVLANTFAVATYVRPEYFTAMLVLETGAAWWFVRGVLRRTWSPRRGALLLLATLGPALVLVEILGNPLDSGRSFFAFAQHYSINVVRSRGLDIDPWTNWETLVSADFGSARTIGAVVRANPRAFLWHLATNARSLPAAAAALLIPREDLSKAFVVVSGSLFAIATCVGLTGSARRILAPKKNTLASKNPSKEGAVEEDDDDEARKGLKVTLLSLALVGIPTSISVLVMLPRGHYLVVPLCFLLVVVGAGLRPRSGEHHVFLRRSACALALLLLAFVPTLSGRAPLDSVLGRADRPRPYLQTRWTVDFLRSLGITSPVVVLESEFSRAFLAGMTFERVAQWDKYGPFLEFLANRNVNIVILNWRLRHDTRFREDPEFVAFDAAPRDARGFTIFPVPGTDVRVAVRNDVAAPGAP